MSAEETFEVVHPAKALVTLQEAQTITIRLKGMAHDLWREALDAYRKGVHLAMGHSSWGHYCRAEFQFGQSTAYRLLDAAKVLEHLEGGTYRDEESSPNGESLRPQSEGVARALVPAMRNGGQQAVQEAWGEARDEFGPEPTAEQVKGVVARKLPPKPKPPERPAWHATMRTLEDEVSILRAVGLEPEQVAKVRAAWADVDRVLGKAADVDG